MFAKAVLFSCIIILFLQENECAKATKKSKTEERLVEFSGAPIDHVSTADSPANVLIIRSNLRGKIKIIVNRRLSMRDIKANVKFNGFKGSNLTDHSVKYERKPGDSNTIRLEVCEPSIKVSGKKLTRTSIIVIITTVSTCLISVLLAVTGLVAIAFYHKYKRKKERKLKSRYDSDDDYSNLSSSSESLYDSGDGRKKVDGNRTANSVGKNGNSDNGSRIRIDKNVEHSVKGNPTANSVGKKGNSDNGSRIRIDKNVEHSVKGNRTANSVGKNGNSDNASRIRIDKNVEHSVKGNPTANSVGKNGNSDNGSRIRIDKNVEHSVKERKDDCLDQRETVEQPNILVCKTLYKSTTVATNNTPVLNMTQTSGTSEWDVRKSPGIDKNNLQTGTNALQGATNNTKALREVSTNGTTVLSIDKSRGIDTKQNIVRNGTNTLQGSLDNPKSLKKSGTSELDIDNSRSIDSNKGNFQSGTNVIQEATDDTKASTKVRTSGTELHFDKSRGIDTYKDNPKRSMNPTHAATGYRQVLQKAHTNATAELNIDKSRGIDSNKDNPKRETNTIKGHQYSADTLKVHNTKTNCGSRINLTTEEVRSAELVIRPRGSTSEVSLCTDMEYPEREARRMNITEEGVDGTIDTQGHVSLRIKNLSEKGNCGASSQRVPRSGGKINKLSGSHSLLIACLFTHVSISMAMMPDLNLMQTATADITIEIPDGFFKEVKVFVNENHKNKVTVTGDEHLFRLKVLDVASAAEVKKDKCKRRPSRACGIGACDPIAGKCVCPRGYLEKFRKCVPDCSTECPFESFMDKACTKTTTGVCKRCRSQCPPGKYESTECGGTMDRECSPISRLPPVKLGKQMVAEDRKKVIPIHQKIYPKDNKQTVVQMNRGSGVEIVISVTEANFATIVGEVKPRYYDKDPSEHPHPICSHNVPIYYKATMRVTQKMFYFPWGGKGRCDMKNPKMEKGYLYCLGSDHNILGLFTDSKLDRTDLKYTQASRSCTSNKERCAKCRTYCTSQSKLPLCKGRQVQCLKICLTTKCSCSQQKCPCYRYDVENCNGRATACTGMMAYVIKLEPVFSQNDQYCNVKLLRLATYKYRADLYVENELVISRDYHAKNHSDVNKGNVLEDDFGYLIVKMPDSPTLKNKHLLLKRAKNAKTLQLGYISRLPARWAGGARKNLALMPARPFSISKAKWNKLKCNDVNSNSFVAFNELPLHSSLPRMFDRIYAVSTKDTKDKRGFGKDIGRTFAVTKTGTKGFLDFTIPRSRSILLHIFPKSKINPDGLYCRLLNKTSHWLIAAEGYLTSCPGSFAAKVFDQDKLDELLFHHDFAVKTKETCYFKFEFNIPFKNGKNRKDKAFLLHLIARDQTIKFVLVREKKVERILQSIHIPKIDKGKLFNTIVAISVIFGGFVFLIILIVIIGALTKPKDRMYQADRDNEFHFRHALVIVWFVGARLGKSIIFTFTFMSYIFVVLHSTNYHTLRSFKVFQQRERTVFRNIFQDMERHRVVEISRQAKRLTEERNICERNLQKLDSYLSNRKRESSWQQQINKKTRSIKLTAIRRFRENWAKSRKQFEKRKFEMQETMVRSFYQIKRQLDVLEHKVMSHTALKGARILYAFARLFTGKSFPRYVGLDQDFRWFKYTHKLESFRDTFNKVERNLKNTESRQENSENLNHNLWQKLRKKSREYATQPKIAFPKPKIGVKFDEEKAKDIFALTWIQDIVKDKILSKIGMILMVTLDVLFFIYRHTRTYAMAVMMIYGLQKLCDLDEMEKKRQEEEEKREILRRGLPPHWQTGSSDLSSSDEESNWEDQGLVGDGLTTSTDEFHGKKKSKPASKMAAASKKGGQEIMDTSSTSSMDDGKASAKNTSKTSNKPEAESYGEDFDKGKITTMIPRQRGKGASKNSRKRNDEEEEEMPGEDFDKNKITKSIPRQRGKFATMFSKKSNEPEVLEMDSEKSSTDEESKHERSRQNYNTYKGYHPVQRGPQEPTMAKEANDIALGVTGKLAAFFYAILSKMKIFDLIRLVALNTHLIIIFCLVCVASAAIYFTFITAKYVLRTPILDELGFFNAKILPILTYRKAVNTRTAANAFMVNHVWIPYYETRINARFEIYKFKARLYKKVQCARTVLYNSEFCSWKKVGQACDRLKPYNEDFFKNLTQYKCTMKPAFSRRYSNFDKVQFKKEMIRSYDPYIVALRGIILNTFDMVFVIICIQVAINCTASTIFKILLSFDMIRQIKVYQSKRPLEVWDLK